MTAKIFEFSGPTKLDIDPDRVLKKAEGKLQGVVLMGYDKDGDFFAASSYADGGDVLWLIELLKKQLMP